MKDIPNNNLPEEALYSKIIGPEDYNRIISKEHRYIAASDNFLAEFIEERVKSLGGAEVVELGCGPGRILPLVGKIKGINLTGIDHDMSFIKYAQKIIKDKSIKIILLADIETYQHDKPVNIFYSQGVHHHIPKGKRTYQYLSNVFKQLSLGGYYLVSDEFVPDYKNNEERELRLTIWYSHIISHALKDGYEILAQEEAKTLLDDIYEGRSDSIFKTSDQINLVLSRVGAINAAAEGKQLGTAFSLAKAFIGELKSMEKNYPSGIDRLDLSRGDYKICDREFRKEVEDVGFEIESKKSFGPIEIIGGMVVYILKKTNELKENKV